MIGKLSSKTAVLKAIAECDKVGAEKFLRMYGFGPATRYHLLYKGTHYDSKAIVGVAYGKQFGKPLTSGDFGGGKNRVVPKLQALGFKIVADNISLTSGLPEEAETSHFWEGAKQTVVINRFERNDKAKAQCIEHYGAVCFFCKFDFAKRYGDDFLGFIHVHHVIPLAAKRAEYKVNPKTDLRPVCPNCHAVIHYGGKTRSVSEMMKLVGKR